jgi:hypothetical protein
LTAERDLSVGIVACLQTHGSRANWHPPLHLFVRLELFDADQAAGMLAWPHSGLHVHTAVGIPEDDRAFAKRLARRCARNPVELERLTYDRTAKAVTYRSDKSKGPTAGTETADPLEFLARVLTHIPDKGQVESPRDCRRLHSLRGLEYATDQSFLAGGPGAGRPD